MQTQYLLFSVFTIVLGIGLAHAENAPVEYRMKIDRTTGSRVVNQCIPADHNQLGPSDIAMPINIIGLRVKTSPTQPSEVAISIIPPRLDVTLKCDPTGLDPAIPCSGAIQGQVTRRKEQVSVRWHNKVWLTLDVFLTGWFNQNQLDLRVVLGNMNGTIERTGKASACWLNYHITGRNKELPTPEKRLSGL